MHTLKLLKSLGNIYVPLARIEKSKLFFRFTEKQEKIQLMVGEGR